MAGPAMGRGGAWTTATRLAALTGAPALHLEGPRGLDDPSLRAAAACLAEEGREVRLDGPAEHRLLGLAALVGRRGGA